MMITHQHLSKLEYYDMDAGKESYSSAESELIIEGWHSEVIITTFVQWCCWLIVASIRSSDTFPRVLPSPNMAINNVCGGKR